MRTFLVMLMTVFMITMPMAEHAEAKRLGGGFSLGKSFSSPKKSTAPTQQKKATTDQTKQTAGTATKRAGMGGLMAGLWRVVSLVHYCLAVRLKVSSLWTCC